MPRVSVIIPTFNRAALLRDAVTSVLEQTVRPDEIIVVDDGSTDDTSEVCKAFPEPVRYIRQSNAGVPTARNHGVAESHGEILAFLDSDDTWHPRKLEIQLAAHRALPDVAWSTTECTMFRPDGSPVEGSNGIVDGFPVFRAMRQPPRAFFARRLQMQSFRHQEETHEVFTGDAFELFFYGNFIFPSSVLLHREIWHRVGPFDPALLVAQDNEFFHRVAAEFPVGILMTPLMRYRVGLSDKNTAPANTIQLIRNAIESVDRAARSPRRLTGGERAAYRTGRQRLVRRLAYAYLSNGEPDEARDALSAGWRNGAARGAPDLLLLHAASHLPRSLLRAFRGIKRSATERASSARGGAGSQATKARTRRASEPAV